MLDLFLHKGLTGWDLEKAKRTGEQRGGAYVARVQTGYEKDGSPKYRYFDTEEEYDSYLRGSGRKKERDAEKKKQSDNLKEKTDKEHSKEKKKHSELFTAQAKKEKRRKDSEKETKKSLDLYLRSKL